MIAFLKGRLVHKEPTFVMIDVGGVGYQATISLATYSDIKDQENIFLYTHLTIREDAHILFGFSNEAEKKLFQQLISVNGVGPGTAIVMWRRACFSRLFEVSPAANFVPTHSQNSARPGATNFVDNVLSSRE